eukprot:COSAG02_NODE_13582_length_1376_cov_1.674236_2_plen_173_part_00
MCGASGTINAICGPVDMSFRDTFGRDVLAAEFIAASSDAQRARCIVQKEDDLHQAIRQMDALGTDVLLVMQDSKSAAVSDVVGVVTKTDISKNLSRKSTLMARDRTLLKPGAPKPASVAIGATVAAMKWKAKGLDDGEARGPRKNPRPAGSQSTLTDQANDMSVEIQQFGSE